MITFWTTAQLDMGLHKLAKNCFLIYLSSGPALVRSGEVPRSSMSFLSGYTDMFDAHNVLLTSVEEDLPVNGLLVCFSNSQECYPLSVLLIYSGLYNMVEGEYFPWTYIVLPFFARYVDKVTWYEKCWGLQRVGGLVIYVLTDDWAKLMMSE